MAREADAGRIPAEDVRPAGEVGRRRSIFGFIGECWAELKKVEWPTQNQVIQGTVVVLVACAIAGVYLWLNDQLWKEVVQKLILGQ
jgi:preprotein translocase subunit SecE